MNSQQSPNRNRFVTYIVLLGLALAILALVVWVSFPTPVRTAQLEQHLDKGNVLAAVANPPTAMIANPSDPSPLATRPPSVLSHNPDRSQTVLGEVVVKLKRTAAELGIEVGPDRNPQTNLEVLIAKHKVISAEPVFSRASRKTTLPKAAVQAGNQSKSSAPSAERDDLFRWYRIKFPEDADVDAILKEIGVDADVEIAEPNIIRMASDGEFTGLPDSTTDPLYGDQWHLVNARVPNAWLYLQQNGVNPGGSRNVVVAVLDTGVDYNHEDLVGNMWVNSGEIPGNGIDDDNDGFIDDIHGVSVVSDARSHSGDPIDLAGHGTHVAGIIAATGKNHLGGVGVAFNCQIMAIRAGQPTGAFSTTDIAEGILYAVDHGADVINMSFGGYARSQIEEDALAVALSKCVLVAAAGNDGVPYSLYPAALPYVLGVQANGITDARAWFSNAGDISAGGESITSTLPGNRYAAWSGTSMAAPIVSGVAALMRSYFFQQEVYSSRFITAQIASNTRSGIVDAYAALTVPPKPGVSVLNFWLLDPVSTGSPNDGDGRIDSGETVQMAVELINRSGAADDVVSILRAVTPIGDDPYVTIDSGLIQFGSIGPWNSADSGITRDGTGKITGFTNPFVFTVAPNTPNDHLIHFVVTTLFTNGWDPNDSEIYERVNEYYLPVQRGTDVPTVISQDTTLTSDRYWLVPRNILIQPGATLHIQPGTQVQWGGISNDPYNPGPQNGELFVRGTLIAEGTATQPVSLFPSSFVAGQTTKITVQDGGICDLHYTKIRNPQLSEISKLDHCYVDWDRGNWLVVADYATHTIFHKLRGVGGLGFALGVADTCLFDSNWLLPDGQIRPPTNGFDEGVRRKNCVFLEDNENVRPLTFVVPTSFAPLPGPSGNWRPFLNPQYRNGSTYTSIPMDNANTEVAEVIANYYGGHVETIENQEEQDFLYSYVSTIASPDPRRGMIQCIGLSDRENFGDYQWLDGSPLSYTNWAPGFPVPLTIGTHVVAFTPQWGNLKSQGGPIFSFVLRLPGAWTEAALNAPLLNGAMLNFMRPNYRGDYRYNAFLNRYWDPNVNTWLRFRSHVNQASAYSSMLDNYWGTSSAQLIDHAITDFNDNFTSAKIEYGVPPEHGFATTFPFVDHLLINGTNVASVPVVDAGYQTYTVAFNRDMNTTVQPFVSFGPSPPYTDFVVPPIGSGWVDARTWQGRFYVTPVTGQGFHLMRVSGAVAADDPWLVSGEDTGRFRFQVRTASAASLTLQATGQEGRIRLDWAQDDYGLVAGYNLYRSASINGPYQTINATIIPPGDLTFTDTAVTPAVPMFYRFTVVLTDLRESDYSNVASAAAVDTLPPVLTHTAVTTAQPGLSLRISAEATDNVAVTQVTLRYRPIGGTSYSSLAMTTTSAGQWSATIPGSSLLPPGLEYYVTATDGINTVFSGTASGPHMVVVSNQPSISSVTPNRGPAAGGTTVNISGTLFQTGATVRFGDEIAQNVVVVSANQITCTSPPHFPAMVDVTVINPDQTQAVRLQAFQCQQSGMVVSLPATAGDSGTMVDVPLMVDNASGLRSADVVLNFNSSIIQPRNVRVGSLTAGWALAANTITPGRIVLSLASATSVSGSGSLVIVTFEVVGAPPAMTPLTITSASLNDGALGAILSNGSLNVNGFFNVAGRATYFGDGGAVPGVNFSLIGGGTYSGVSGADGTFTIPSVRTGSYSLTPSKTGNVAGITAFDAALVLQVASGLRGATPGETSAADVNRNGLVTALDASYILEKAVGLRGVPFPGAGKVWDFLPAQRTYSLINSHLSGQDFTAVLIGDLSGNWTSGASVQSNGLTQSTSPPVIIGLAQDAINAPDDRSALLLVKLPDSAGYSIEFTLTFAPSASLTAVEPGQFGAGYALAFNGTTAGTARVACARAMSVSGEGALLVLRFNAAPGTINIQGVQVDESRTPWQLDSSLAAFDDDHDGIVNVNEQRYGTDSTKADTDGDGQKDGAEILAGTSPTDSSSRFVVTAVTRPSANALALTWSSVPGKRYRVEASSDLVAGQWSAIGVEVTASSPQTTVMINITGAPVRGYYRIVVIQQ